MNPELTQKLAEKYPVMNDTPRTDAQLEYDSTTIDDVQNFARKLERENAALKADKERLDWLETSSYWPHPPIGEDIRAAIDAARKEAT